LILLADNDIILKLAQCDLVGGFSELLGEPAGQVYITPTARYQLLPKKMAKAIDKCGDEATVSEGSLTSYSFYLRRPLSGGGH
jgi:hypothetical protein